MPYFKLIIIFSKTIVYYLQSVVHPDRILELKTSWARYCLNFLGYELTESGIRPESKAGLILVGNHISFLDIFALMSINPHVTFIAKKEVRRWPIIGISAARVGTVFIDRSPSVDRTKSRLEVAEQIQKNSSYVTVFPSGTTSLIENKPWKKGIFEISKTHNVPVYAFKLSYEPLRESAYIDDDDLITQMLQMFKIKNKKVHLKWLGQFEIEEPQRTAEEIRRAIEVAPNI